MAVAFRSSSSLSFGNRADSGMTLPAGHVANDILVFILFVQDNDGFISVTGPSGYTAVGGSASGLLVDVDPSSFGTAEMQIWAWWKRDNGSESNPATTHLIADATAGYLGCYSGAVLSGDPTDNPNASSNQGGTPGAGAPGIDNIATGVTTAVDGSAIIGVWGVWDSYGATSPPSGMTERLELIALYVADEIRATAGATGDKTITSATTGGSYAAGLIALEAEPAAATGVPIITAVGQEPAAMIWNWDGIF